MRIVVLDGYTANPGDLDWSAIESLAQLTVYDRTDDADIVARAQGAEILLTNKTTLSRAVIMEEIEHGQRIRQFVLEAQTPDQRWHELRAGSSIGHKRIITFDPISAVALRLRCLNPAGSPLIRMLAALPESARV